MHNKLHTIDNYVYINNGEIARQWRDKLNHKFTKLPGIHVICTVTLLLLNNATSYAAIMHVKEIMLYLNIIYKVCKCV